MVPSVPSCPVRVALLSILIGIIAGCETYTVEYRKRPEYYANWGGEVPDRVVREDGTVVLYNADPDEGDPGAPVGPRRSPWIEKDDGSIEIDARTPEEMLAVILQCLQSKRWDVMWDQVLAEQTRLAYDSQAEGRDAFKIEMERKRVNMARTLNRMIAGLGTHEVIMDSAGPNALRIRLWPQTVREAKLKIKEIILVEENFGIRLAAVK